MHFATVNQKVEEQLWWNGHLYTGLENCIGEATLQGNEIKLLPELAYNFKMPFTKYIFLACSPISEYP